MELPEAVHKLPQWVTAIECLMLVGEQGGDPMVPRIAMMKALDGNQPRAAPAPRRKRAKAASRNDDACFLATEDPEPAASRRGATAR
jgi:hypothetical protein